METQTGGGEWKAKIKASTHAIAGTLAAWIVAGAAFASSAAGQAFIKQYPRTTAVAGLVTAAAAAIAAYRKPS